jgi:hypothetical protein
MDARGKPPDQATHYFFLKRNPADMNELGRQLNRWLPEPSEEVRVEWRKA